jgi:hypothetical protein
MTDHDTPPNTHRIHVDVFPSLPVCWVTLSEPEIEEEHEALADWIAWLIDRYTLDHRTIPPCWDQHGPLIEELSALRTAWLAAYAVTGRPEAPWTGTPTLPQPGSGSPIGWPAPAAGRASTEHPGDKRDFPGPGIDPPAHRAEPVDRCTSPPPTSTANPCEGRSLFVGDAS